MPSMIENLIGGGVRRRDEKRLLPTRRPLPVRPRELLELFVAMGGAASMKSLMLSADFREADSRNLTYTALSRWPTAQEHAAQSDPYEFGPHLRALILGQEFRESLFRRICDAYPERQRLFYVRIPRCAGQQFLSTTAPMHPLFNDHLAAWRRGDGQDFVVALATYLARFNTTKTIMASLQSQHPAIATQPPPSQPGAPFPWCLNPPPYRAGDRLFAILREPRSLILSLVNAQVEHLTHDATKDAAKYLKQHARGLLLALPHRNPLCTALGDGTAESALALCRLTDIELADLSRYPTWIRYTWDTDAEPPATTSTPVLTLEDLDADDARFLDGIIAEDLVFYQHVSTALARLGEFQTFVRGRHL